MDIANSRSQFLAGLDGNETFLRYMVFILGRSVMPLVLVSAFFYGFRFKYWLLIALFVFSVLSLEKAAPIFIFLPGLIYFFVFKRWFSALGAMLLICVSVMFVAFLSMGGIADSRFSDIPEELETRPVHVFVPPDMPIQEAMGRPGRFFFPNELQELTGYTKVYYDPRGISGKLVILLNRIVWIPYVTAYDWLGFHRSILRGELTLGRSIGFVHFLYGEPKMPLEKMVYVYEFGASPGGAGASNTVFFVDAKLVFGWGGVIVYCLFFTFFSACIFSSGNRVLMVSSVVCFFVASVSSLTATLLSGGLFIYVILAFLLFEREPAPSTLQSAGGEE
ncbi:hypothetical protein [Pseudomonas gingeri]|uniref:hypothetical protein n=1 Tax=Pseudomonas gingeri TaxID=117681 RepID=UPI0015B82EFC|nr:hypothetical protein [Pseudomonas gingeri]NWD49601.1 hypothetical protein [Pseudomonas gingeri]